MLAVQIRKRKTRQMKGTKKFVQALQLLMESRNVRPEAFFLTSCLKEMRSETVERCQIWLSNFVPAIGTLPHWELCSRIWSSQATNVWIVYELAHLKHGIILHSNDDSNNLQNWPPFSALNGTKRCWNQPKITYLRLGEAFEIIFSPIIGL